MQNPKKIDTQHKELSNKAAAVIKIGAITAGTQLGTALIHRLAKHPVFLFGLGVVSGVYIAKNRKQIITSANYLVEQSKAFILKPDEDE